MAVTALLFGQALQSAFNKEISWSSDSLKVMLCTSSFAPNQDTMRYRSSVTNEVAGSGYTAGGATLGSPTLTYTASTNTLMLDAADVSWPTSTITARYAIIYDATPSTDATRPLIAYVDFGADVISTGGTFAIAWDAAGIVSLSAA